MEHKDKSLLDGMEVKEQGFPISRGTNQKTAESSMIRNGVIVGHCPKCGGPIYGPTGVTMGSDSPPPFIYYSCGCRVA